MTDEPQQQPDPGQGLSLALSEDGRKLLAVYSPAENRVPFDIDWIKQKIAGDVYGRLFLFDKALSELTKRYKNANDAFTMEIGEVRDASASVEVSSDRMVAYLTITPPYGGQPITEEQIRQALQAKQVVSCLLQEAIEQALHSGEADKLEVARGRPAINGDDGRLQCLIEMARERRPRLDEHGRVNYRDLGGVITVHEGERLMQNVAPTPGENGENVLGQAIPARPGKPASFAPKLEGAVISAEDPAILLAAISGQPVLANNGMTVEPTISLKCVDLTTGNIDFDGTVNIAGDVHAGMRVRATGDIHVGGTVEAAGLEAGGDVVIKGGIIGHGEVHAHPPDAENSPIARVRCGGSCSARFIENASVEASDSIMVEELIMQSEVAAINHILVGKPGKHEGHIVGGLVEANLLIQAGVIGASSGVKTRLEVGTNPYLHEKLHQANKKMEAYSKELEDVIKILQYFQTHPDRVKPDICTRAGHTREVLLQAIEETRAEIEQLNLQRKLAEDARIVAEKEVFCGVEAKIGSKVMNIPLQRSAGTFKLNEEGELELS